MDRCGHRHLPGLSVAICLQSQPHRSEKQDTWTPLAAPINMTRRWPHLIKCLVTCSLFFCESDSADLDTDHCWHWLSDLLISCLPDPDPNSVSWGENSRSWVGTWYFNHQKSWRNWQLSIYAFRLCLTGSCFYCSEQKVSPYCSQKLKALFITLFLWHFCPEY